MADFPWPVETHALGFRNRATGELSAFVEQPNDWNSGVHGGFLVSCPACFDNNSSPAKHCDSNCLSKSYGAVLDYIVPLNQHAAKKEVIGGFNAATLQPARGKPPAERHFEQRVVVLEGIVPYGWSVKSRRPSAYGEPLFTDVYGASVSTTKSTEHSVFIGLYAGDVTGTDEIYILLSAA